MTVTQPDSIVKATGLFGLSLYAIMGLCGLIVAPAAQAEPLTPTNSVTVASPATEAKKEDPNRENKLSLSAMINSKSVEDSNVNAKMSGTTISLTGERNFTSYLSGNIDISLLMLTGNYSSRYTGEGAAPNGLVLNEANLTAKPFSSLAISAGVLPVEFSSLMVSTFDGAGFPGVKEAWTPVDSDNKLSIWASQTTPTSSTAAVKSSEAGVNSQLQLSGVAVETNTKDTDNLTFKLAATRFDFQNLTTSAAVDSQYYGNSVTQIGTQARFKYEFKGYEVSTSGLVKLGSKWQLEAGAGYLNNEKAPKLLNHASMGQLNIYYLMDGVKLKGSFASFYNEADTLPAAYSRQGLGFNNRFGWMAGIKSEWEKQNVNASLRFVQANEIQDDLYTADRQILSLTVEAKYDIL